MQRVVAWTHPHYSTAAGVVVADVVVGVGGVEGGSGVCCRWYRGLHPHLLGGPRERDEQAGCGCRNVSTYQHHLLQK